MSIKRTVILRNDYHTVYSSEQQERMKVYFELNDKFQECISKCPKQEETENNDCSKKCDKIFDEYVERLEKRYEEEPEKLNAVVKNSPSFTRTPRKDRQGWFYSIVGKSWDEVFGDPSKLIKDAGSS